MKISGILLRGTEHKHASNRVWIQKLKMLTSAALLLDINVYFAVVPLAEAA